MFPFLPIPFYDSIAYDPVKTRLSESEGEKPTNRKVQNRTLSMVSSSASACDSDVISRTSVLLPIFTTSYRSIFFDYESVPCENQPLGCSFVVICN